MRRCFLTLGVLVAVAALPIVPSALAAGSGPPQWVITSVSGPANFPPASSGDQYVVTATNVGGEATSGPVTIEDLLPASGVEVTGIVDSPEGEKGNGEAFRQASLSCPSLPVTSSVSCAYAGAVAPGDTLRLTLVAKVTATGGALENDAKVSGGGAAVASTSETTQVSTEPARFGVANFFSATSKGRSPA